jgi:hypothetical protein
LKKIGILLVLTATAGWVSCGGGGSSKPTTNQTFLAKRAFITNSSTTNGAAVVSIIDALKDLFGNHAITVAPGTNVIATTIPGKVSVVSSKTTNQVAIIDNTLEAVRATISLPAETESMAVTPDGKFAFAAVHNTNTVEVIDLSNSVLCTTLTTTCRGPITISAPTKVVLSGDGKTLLAFSDNPTAADSVVVIDATQATSTTGITTPIVPVNGFHKAVNGVFASDNVTAYIMNCGEECGGAAGTAGVQVLQTTAATNTGTLGSASATVPATVAALDSGNLYVAGTAPPTPPGSPVVLNSGRITKLNATTLAPVGSGDVLPPGYHDTIAVQSGKVFVGSKACTVTSGSNQSCLGIFDGTHTVISSVYEGDVTGMQAISGRSVVYVIIGGELRIYDANTSAPQTQQLDIIGHAEQVVQVDP